VLVAPAGLRESGDEVESTGIGRARAEAERADLLLWMGKAEDAPDHADLIALRAKADLGPDSEDTRLAVSAVTGEGLHSLTALLVERAKRLLPKGDELALDRRQHDLLGAASAALGRGAKLSDPVLIAEELRAARQSIDLIAGRAGVDNLLDALFGRFCLGK